MLHNLEVEPHLTFFSVLTVKLCRLYMDDTWTHLILWLHLGPSLQKKVHDHSNGQLLVNVESVFVLDTHNLKVIVVIILAIVTTCDHIK